MTNETHHEPSTELSTQPADSASPSGPEISPEAASEVVSEVVPDATPEVVADAAPEVVADAAPEVVADAAPEVVADAAPEVEPAVAPETEPAAPAEAEAAAPAEPEAAAPAEPEAAAPAEPEPVPETGAAPETAAAPTPTARPRPTPPSPAALAAALSASRPPVVAPVAHSDSATFGRVAEDGTVFVISGEHERAVGSYPGASAHDALQYFARKYDEIFGMATLLEQRLAGPSELSAKDASDQLKHLSEQVAEPAFVGDLTALQALMERLGSAVEARREDEAAHRAAAKAAAGAEREELVARAESIAATDPAKIQWKRSGEELRALFEQWKAHQRSGVKLDKHIEAELWQRFSAARTSFEKARRTHFAELESTQSEAKSLKTRLVSEAESLATSKDWGPTAREFKRLMDRWRAAGRAGRADDDALWGRFKAAQDSFFNAKDEVVAAEEDEYRANLTVKEALLVEANALLPVSDLDAAKTSLRSIQDRWDEAGKVPRADMERTEKSLRRVEQAIRDLDEKKWTSSNPEALARATSLVVQLERAVADLEQDLAAAEAKGNERKVAEARAALAARQGWLDQARAGLKEFS